MPLKLNMPVGIWNCRTHHNSSCHCRPCHRSSAPIFPPHVAFFSHARVQKSTSHSQEHHSSLGFIINRLLFGAGVSNRCGWYPHNKASRAKILAWCKNSNSSRSNCRINETMARHSRSSRSNSSCVSLLVGILMVKYDEWWMMNDEWCTSGLTTINGYSVIQRDICRKGSNSLHEMIRFDSSHACVVQQLPGTTVPIHIAFKLNGIL